MLIVSFLITLFLIPFCIVFSKKLNILDFPDERKLHKNPVPKSGGIAILITYFSILAYTSSLDLVFLLSIIFLSILIILDDIYQLNRYLRLATQIIIIVPITHSIFTFGNTFIAAFNKSTLDKNIITRINCAYIMDDTAIYKPANDPGLGVQLNKTREYFGPVNIERLHVSLIDEYGKILDLNNMDWSMTLLFESLYD